MPTFLRRATLPRRRRRVAPYSAAAPAAVTASLSATLGDVTLSGAATSVAPGNSTADLSATLDAVTLTGAATSAAPAASNATLSATLDAFTLSGAATAGFPSATGVTLSATLADISFSGAATSTAPSGTGVTLSSTLDAVTLTGAVTAGAAGAVAADLSATLDSVTLTGAATSVAPGNSDAGLTATLDAITLTGSATAGASGAVAATLAATLDAITVSAAATAGTPANTTANLGGSGSTPAFQSYQSGISNSTNTTTVAWPASIAAGDLLIAVYHRSTSAASVSSEPGDLTPIRTTANPSDSDFELRTYYRIADGTESGSISWVTSGLSRAFAGIVRITGAATSSPIDVEDIGSGTGTTATFPSVTTTGANRLVVRIAAQQASGQVYTMPATSRFVVNDGTGGVGVRTGLSTSEQTAAGASGTDTATWSTSALWIAATLAIKPASSPVVLDAVTLTGAVTAGIPGSTASLDATLDAVTLTGAATFTAAAASNATLAVTLDGYTLTAYVPGNPGYGPSQFGATAVTGQWAGAAPTLGTWVGAVYAYPTNRPGQWTQSGPLPEMGES